MVKILFVCLGNICRSPAAEGVFRHIACNAGLDEKITVDSAGTGNWHIGQQPDSRVRAVAHRRGIDLSSLRARQVGPPDFERFDYIVAMDRGNVRDLMDCAPGGHARKIVLLLDFLPEFEDKDVPDPYQGSARDFEIMFQLVERGVRALMEHIEDQHFSTDS